MVDAFVRGDILQVLLVSLLFGIALLSQGDRARSLVTVIEQLSHALFAIVGIVMRLAPIGAFGAMAFTVGRYGIGTLLSLGKLMAGVYITCLLFILIVLGTIAAAGRARPVAVSPLHRGRDPHRPRHVFVRVRAAAADGEAGAARLQQACGRARDSDGLLVQSRRHRDLHDDGGGVRRAGERRASVDA